MKILLVEDHAMTARSIQYYFAGKHSVTHAATCQDAESHLARQHYDAIILDLNLPDGSSEHLCSALSAEKGSPAILVISGKNDTATKVRTLDLGADDYITKPFTSPELFARVAAVHRRTRPDLVTQGLVFFAGLSLDQQTLDFQGKSVTLTRTEAQLASIFLKYPRQTHSRAHLGGERRGSLEVHIKNLRQKIAHISTIHYITTIYGLGYRMDAKSL